MSTTMSSFAVTLLSKCLKRASRRRVLLAPLLLLLLGVITAVTLVFQETPVQNESAKVEVIVEQPVTTLDFCISSFNMTNDSLPLYNIAIGTPRIRGRKRVFIYNKNRDVNADEFSGLDGEKFVINLTNVGRESHTFLHHIITNYDDLADQTFFCQDNPHETPANFEHFFRGQLDSKIGYAGLGYGFSCPCLDCNVFNVAVRGMREVYELVHGESCPEWYHTVLNGCFLASKRRIRRTPKCVYETLLRMLLDPEIINKNPSWNVTYVGLARQFGYVWNLNSPYFGHVLERSWTIIMRCITGSLCWD